VGGSLENGTNTLREEEESGDEGQYYSYQRSGGRGSKDGLSLMQLTKRTDQASDMLEARTLYPSTY
jgi:hypothetical protein